MSLDNHLPNVVSTQEPESHTREIARQLSGILGMLKSIEHEYAQLSPDAEFISREVIVRLEALRVACASDTR